MAHETRQGFTREGWCCCAVKFDFDFFFVHVCTGNLSWYVFIIFTFFVVFWDILPCFTSRCSLTKIKTQSASCPPPPDSLGVYIFSEKHRGERTSTEAQTNPTAVLPQLPLHPLPPSSLRTEFTFFSKTSRTTAVTMISPTVASHKTELFCALFHLHSLSIRFSSPDPTRTARFLA